MTDKQRKFIDDIFNSGKHLLSLINDILDLSKVEAGKMLLDLDAVDISSLLRNSLSIIKGQAAARHVRLDMRAPDRLGFMNADARKVKQIVYNLLSNAVKFSADGGEVVLRAGRVPRADVGVLTGRGPRLTFPLAESPFSEFLKVSVTDNGIGITPDGLAHLFKPFSQVDSGLARKFEGTGLGLAMVKLLVDLHGGVVAVESDLGKGSCFTVWIPMRAPENADKPQPKAPTRRTERLSGSRTALVVESNYKSADLIRMQLEAEGFTVLHAATPETAIRLAEQEPLAVITLDIMMPGVDGWALIKRLKDVPAARLVPIVIISILADRTKGFALGAAAVMQSPVSRQELSDCLDELGLSPISADRPVKVLIVDDDPKAVEMIAVRIHGLANTILRAYGGREAIAMAERELPDLIVLDLIMPEVNGFEVVDALNENPATAHIPIVVVTASEITAADRERLNGFVSTVMGKAGFDGQRFMCEVRRAMASRAVVA
jgi:CheY-like chemotaxis protein/two-component sensor histidine kinase